MQRPLLVALVSLFISGSSASTAFAADSDIQKTTDATFSQDVLNSKEPVFLDFFTTWCVPCKVMEPRLQKLAEDSKGKFKLLAIDAEKNPIVAEKYAVTIYPCFAIIVNGKVAVKKFGAKTDAELKAMLTEAHLN